jgi:hypothetical protein
MAEIILDEKEQAKIDSGECVLLGAVFYNVRKGSLEYQVVTMISLEEVQGILAKFNRGVTVAEPYPVAERK